MSARDSAHSQPVAAAGLIRALSFQPQVLRRLAYEHPDDFPVLLDSAAQGPLGRYSILAAYPQQALWQDASGCVFSRYQGSAATALPEGFLDALERAWRAQGRPQSGLTEEAGPFHGGWLVFLGYELADEIEPKLALPARPAGQPAAFALRVACALVYDHERGLGWAVAEPGRSDLLARLQTALSNPPSDGAPPGPLRLAATQEEAPERFRSRVEAAQRAIAAGEIYQANLSRPWRTQLQPPWTQRQAVETLYERLRQTNPAPFAALAQFQDWALLSSSPERLVRVQGGSIETRPIAGTRARSGRGGEDAREVAALIAHPKERAEHVMLIDLERNDLGRVCQAGSVRADEFMFTESYAHVHHIVSNVRGRLRADVTPVDVLRALMPGGTITGVPKFRCMQLIAELEGEARGAYTGALGFINLDGAMDLNILIRTLTLQQGGIEFRAGAGIVADSDPERELAETRAKARGLLAALT